MATPILACSNFYNPQFIYTRLIRTAFIHLNQALIIAQQLNELRLSDRKRLNELGRMTGSANQILDALFEQPIASINKIIELTGLTAATVGKLLDALEHKLSMVKEITGQKRNRVFAYVAYVDILNQD